MRLRLSPPAPHVARRTVLSGLAAAGLAAAARPPRALAQAAPHEIAVGTARLSVLSDGTMSAPLGWVLPDRKPEEIAAALAGTGRAAGDFPLQVNVALIRTGAETILIDTGAGSDFAPARGKLPERLAAAGVKPEAVTRVVFTHGHPDHLWGVVDPFDGGPLFPNAKLHMCRTERDAWLKPGLETTMPEAARGGAVGTQRRLKELGDRIHTFEPGTEIVPGLATIDSAGHTPGHVSVVLTSGSAQLVIGGDALIEPVISFARPRWRWGADMDPDRAIASRVRLLDRLAREKSLLLGYHLPWPGLGRVEASGDAWRLIAA